MIQYFIKTIISTLHNKKHRENENKQNDTTNSLVVIKKPTNVITVKTLHCTLVDCSVRAKGWYALHPKDGIFITQEIQIVIITIPSCNKTFDIERTSIAHKTYTWKEINVGEWIVSNKNITSAQCENGWDDYCLFMCLWHR
jgi:hypothetical protein